MRSESKGVKNKAYRKINGFPLFYYTLLVAQKYMREDLKESGGEIAAIYYCPHGWDDGCECRKPKPGMIFQES